MYNNSIAIRPCQNIQSDCSQVYTPLVQSTLSPVRKDPLTSAINRCNLSKYHDPSKRIPQIQSIYRAIYQCGEITSQDILKLKKLRLILREEIKEQQHPEADQKDKECLFKARDLLDDSITLARSIRKFEREERRFSNGLSAVFDCTVHEDFSVDSLNGAKFILKAANSLLKLKNFTEACDSEHASNRFFKTFEYNFEEFSETLKDWGDVLVRDIKKELRITNNPLEMRLQNALSEKCHEICEELEQIITKCHENSDFIEIENQLKGIVEGIKKLPFKHYGAVENLLWGSDEWLLLQEQRPQTQVFSISQFFTQLFQPDQWVNKLRSVLGKSTNAEDAVKIATVPFENDSMSKLTEDKSNLNHAIESLSQITPSISTLDIEHQKELKHYSDLLYKELLRSVENAPAPTCKVDDSEIWSQKVNEQCYAVRTLEEKIAKLIKPLHQVFSDPSLENFGNKHMNLVLQSKLAEFFQVPLLKVPTPKGISSTRTMNLLKNYAPEMFQYHTELAEKFDANKGIHFFNDPEVVSLLGKIDQAIVKAFDIAAKSEHAAKLLLPEGFVEWLDVLKNENEYLSVRSTGAGEDSKTSAIAGGYVSKSYVLPEKIPFITAARDVVRSYFSISSYMKRINDNINPFQLPYKLAVTAQKIIGETMGGTSKPHRIPISLVLFSTEPLYVEKEKFRAMRISAVYGHGEGVVGTRGIPGDTALLLVSEEHPDQIYILYDNQSKPVRLAPVATKEGITLEKIGNPNELHGRRILSDELLMRLYHWGVLTEKFNGYPTDMEIVIKDNIIHSVQARSINRKDSFPTYLDMKKLSMHSFTPISATLRGETTVSGSGSALAIRNPNEIVYAKTLEEAENRFDRNLHKLVIFSHPELPNTHSIVNFSGQGVPCLLIKDYEKVESFVQQASADTPLVACVQTSSIHIWDKSSQNIEDFITKGLAVHPAKIVNSLKISQVHSKVQTKELPEDLESLLVKLKSDPTKEQSLETLQKIRAHTWVKGIKAKKGSLAKLMRDSTFIPTKVKGIYKIIKAFDQTFDKAVNELEAVITHMDEKDRLRPLFFIKNLESLIMPHNSVIGPSQYSIQDIAALFESAQKIQGYQNQLNYPAHFADQLNVGTKIFDPEMESHWEEFLLNLDESFHNHKIDELEVEKFKKTIDVLDRMKLLSTVATFFLPDLTLPPKDVMMTLIELFPSTETGIFSSMEMNFETLKQAQEGLQYFGEKSRFNQAFEEIKTLSESLKTEAIREDYQTSSVMARLVILQNLKELVTTFDNAIKTMLISTEFAALEKLKLLKEMLIHYLGLYDYWMRNVIDMNKTPVHPSYQKNAHLHITSQLTKLKNFLDTLSLSDENQLLPSGAYSVSSGVIGAGSMSSQMWPKTFVELFSTIHQDLMALISREGEEIYSAECLEGAHLPEKVKLAFNEFNPENFGRNLQRVGIETTESDIEITYNVPLNFHSAQLKFMFNKESQSLTTTLKMYGAAKDRWKATETLAKCLNKSKVLTLESPVKWNKNEIAITWKIESIDQLKNGLKVFNDFCSLSLMLWSDLNDELKKIPNQWGDYFRNPQLKQELELALKHM